MGCDIHLYIEKRAIKEIPFVRSEPDPDKKGEWKQKIIYYSEGNEWSPCYFTNNARREFSDRCYDMFAKLADVRNYNDLEPIELRGFPSDASDVVKRSYCYELIPDEEYNEEKYERFSDAFGIGYCKKSYGEKLIVIGASEVIYEENGRKFISGPDWHSPNWCTTEELEECIKEIFYNEKLKGYTPDAMDWTNLLAIMKDTESTGYYECRAVYWFDN